MSRLSLALSLLLLLLLTASTAAAQGKKDKKVNKDDGFGRFGAQLHFVGDLGATLDRTENGTTQTVELDDATSLAFSFYGLLGILDNVDVGLSLALTPGVTLANSTADEFPIGLQTDLDLRAAYKIPFDDAYFELHAEGGLTFLSLDDDHGRSERDVPLYGPTDRYTQDDTAATGWNFGLGAQLGYEIVPLVRLFGGLDWGLYEVQIISATDPDPLIPVAERQIKVDLSGQRLRLTFGLELAL
jgi:hypothetical protein